MEASLLKTWREYKICLIIINTTLPSSSCTQSYENNCPLIAHNLNQKMEASGHTAIVSKVIWSVFKLVWYWVRWITHFSTFRTTKLLQSTSALRSVLNIYDKQPKESLVNFRNLTSPSTSAKTILASAMLGWRSQTRRPLWQVCSNIIIFFFFFILLVLILIVRGGWRWTRGRLARNSWVRKQWRRDGDDYKKLMIGMKMMTMVLMNAFS